MEEDRCDRGASTQDAVSKYILDLLPSDPFGNGHQHYLHGYHRMDLRIWRRKHVVLRRRKCTGRVDWGECSRREDGASASCQFDFGSACDMDDMLDFGCDYKDVPIASVSGDTDMDDVNRLGGDDPELTPHPALSFCLSYLGLSDLLLVERVCKSLHATVRGDPLCGEVSTLTSL
ncbi:F-box SKIP28-like protein [Sesbania bispinosa]|nr:F-box SKIP28-like protein [Sesbania bispinosa]